MTKAKTPKGEPPNLTDDRTGLAKKYRALLREKGGSDRRLRAAERTQLPLHPTLWALGPSFPDLTAIADTLLSLVHMKHPVTCPRLNDHCPQPPLF